MIEADYSPAVGNNTEQRGKPRAITTHPWGKDTGKEVTLGYPEVVLRMVRRSIPLHSSLLISPHP
ncbi:hypothetical protein SAMN06296065_101353 [Novosphingobium panipatense]|uniref:Uncharacterized protein n=1 Tax=Novosphingobium panipatense TaxID=428991 RepID=A0ABY1PYC3_9SPHN|nr:hypothetical protein SAMN06296065_101353 [Novosphingobium panipatense]